MLLHEISEQVTWKSIELPYWKTAGLTVHFQCCLTVLLKSPRAGKPHKCRTHTFLLAMKSWLGIMGYLGATISTGQTSSASSASL